MFAKRVDRVQSAMKKHDIHALLLSIGSDMPWLIGYHPMPLERLTMLVVPADGKPTLVIPKLEVARVVERPELFSILPWEESEDPVRLVAGLVGSAKNLAIGSYTWSRFLLSLQAELRESSWADAANILGPIRAVKDAYEISRLQAAAQGVDRVAALLQRGEIPFCGRTEKEVAGDIAQRILAEGHAKINFVIVASGENSASPHHHTGNRVIKKDEVVLFDIGGTTAEPDGEPGYCSDLTRCLYTGQHPPQEFFEAYESLREAQQRGFEAAYAGNAAQAADAAARSHLEAAGLGEWFVHRLGHGIGVEAHEDPYLVEGNTAPLQVGNVFSVEPGFYIDGKWGARIEDIAYIGDDGPVRLNTVDHRLVCVDS